MNDLITDEEDDINSAISLSKIFCIQTSVEELPVHELGQKSNSCRETESTSNATSITGIKAIDLEKGYNDEEIISRCQICFEPNTLSSFTLPCNHEFCHECLINYLTSKITDGMVYIKCFHINEHPIEISQTENSHENNEKYQSCGALIPTAIIEELLIDKPEILNKYERYRYSKENKNARECPYCLTWNNITSEKLNTINGSKIICINENCKKIFCFYHSNAHDFTIYPSCEEYEASVAPVQQASVSFIQAVSKPCPGCQVMVMKSGEL